MVRTDHGWLFFWLFVAGCGALLMFLALALDGCYGDDEHVVEQATPTTRPDMVKPTPWSVDPACVFKYGDPQQRGDWETAIGPCPPDATFPRTWDSGHTTTGGDK